VLTTFYLEGYLVSQSDPSLYSGFWTPHFQISGISKELIGAAKIGIGTELLKVLEK